MTISFTMLDIAKVTLGIVIGYKLKTQIQAGINSIKKAIANAMTATPTVK